MTEVALSSLSTRAPIANCGRYANEGEALEAIVARLVDKLNPQMIWLFGSRARGQERQDSDFDLLVVARKGESYDDDYDMVHAPLTGTFVGADIIPFDLDVFDASLELKTSFVRKIVDEGRLLYEAAQK